MKFKLEYVMEVDDLELLEIVNDYLRRSDEPTFNTLDDIPEVFNSCFYILVWNG